MVMLNASTVAVIGGRNSTSVTADVFYMNLKKPGGQSKSLSEFIICSVDRIYLMVTRILYELEESRLTI
jgi:hypothetical protein